ncbi:MAG: CvpA family protein [Clostridia bacterium]|nr:CvpA family protein [Clostridia bacterium]MBR2221064.1 CvpA family protein [Clostridia bacterium]
MAYFYLDIIAAVVIVLASIVGMCKGFFATLLSLLGFVGTFVLAYFFSDEILGLLDQICGLPTLIQNALGSGVGNIVVAVVGFIITYILIRLVVFILNHTIGKLFKKGRLVGGVNTFMGFVLGLGKGAVYVALALVAINFASLIPSVKEWSNTAFQQTYVIGKVYNWVGDQLGNYFSSPENQENENQSDANSENS